MNNIRDEFIKAIMISLKIDNNPFISATVSELISHIEQTEYKSFMLALFGTQHAYLNGMDKIAKVAETFKPKENNEIEAKAKRLIAFMENANTQIGRESQAKGEDFLKMVRNDIRLKVHHADLAILDAVKPYCNHKELLINIRHYQTSSDALRAFMGAIQLSSKTLQLKPVNEDVMKMLKSNRR